MKIWPRVLDLIGLSLNTGDGYVQILGLYYERNISYTFSNYERLNCRKIKIIPSKYKFLPEVIDG